LIYSITLLFIIPSTLTINGDNIILQKQVEELTEKTNNNDYLLKAKLQEKDDAPEGPIRYPLRQRRPVGLCTIGGNY
jgi:hypothetical protein